MTTDRTLTVASLTLLATAAVLIMLAFATATPAPRQVVQAPTPTLAEQYTEAWDQLKESP
ncbi:hypothetical protein NJBCHELONAE_02170 [Mycobacteroides chelonae]|uniref:hypothetical protein n=1 Tax=Mycobacteroides chelonae TaxID=1774 RepID=UPI0021DE5230|nr:hypothetical protein [Mycobacteroides chelonae]GLE54906.1 hypothetical protein NJBCHELONAE_02170 [Mycobacteroides chelonae]